MVASLKAAASPHPPRPAADPRNAPWDNDSPIESDCPPDCCMLLLAKYYFWHHRQPKPQTVRLQPESAWFPEIPAMDEAGDFSHTPTQELGKGKAKYKCRSYW